MAAHETQRFNYGASPVAVIAFGLGLTAIGLVAGVSVFFGAGLAALGVALVSLGIGIFALSRVDPGFSRNGALQLTAEGLVVASVMHGVAPQRLRYTEIASIRIEKHSEGEYMALKHNGGTLLLYPNLFDSRSAFDAFLDALNARIQHLPAPSRRRA